MSNTHTTITVSRTVEHIETFTFHRELSQEEINTLLHSANTPNFSELEEQCDQCSEEEIDSSNKMGYNIEIQTLTAK